MSWGPPPTAITRAVVAQWFGRSWHLVRGWAPLDANVPGGGHDGWDIGAKRGTPVYALTDGVVHYARDARKDPNPAIGWAIGGGNVVDIQVGASHRLQYAHLDSILVHEGQAIKKGQKIGTVGSTGFTLGQPHLHFGIWDLKTNKMIDPLPFFQGKMKFDASGADTTTFTVADLDKILSDLGISTSGDYRLTEADAARIIAEAKKRGFTGNLGSGGVGIGGGVIIGLLRQSLGQPNSFAPGFTEATNAEIASITSVATNAAGILAWLADPAHWLGILALVGGAFAAWKGAEFVMSGTAPRTPAAPPAPTV